MTILVTGSAGHLGEALMRALRCAGPRGDRRRHRCFGIHRPHRLDRRSRISKQFTAAAILLPTEDGALHLDDPARRWLPELRWPQQRLTVVLLSHRNDPEPHALALRIARRFLPGS